jgi:hypothetical protein
MAAPMVTTFVRTAKLRRIMSDATRNELAGKRILVAGAAGFLGKHLVRRVAAIKESFEDIKATFDPDIMFTQYRDDRHQPGFRI